MSWIVYGALTFFFLFLAWPRKLDEEALGATIAGRLYLRKAAAINEEREVEMAEHLLR